MRFLKRLKSGNFWISMISAVVLILQAVFNVEIKTEYLNQIILGILGILVMSGIVSESPSNEISIKPNDIVNALDKVGDKISQVLSTDSLSKLKSEEQNVDKKGELNLTENSSKSGVENNSENNIENIIKNILKKNINGISQNNCGKSVKIEGKEDIENSLVEKIENQYLGNANIKNDKEDNFKNLTTENKTELYSGNINADNSSFQNNFIGNSENCYVCDKIENGEKDLNILECFLGDNVMQNQAQNDNLKSGNEDVL